MEASRGEEFRRYLQEHEIKWRFQTPRSPWKGGHFERLISTVKSSLVVSLRNKELNDEQFRTAVAESQAVVNSRPLTYLASGLEEEALTPSHLLRGTSIRTLPVISPPNDGEVSKRAQHQRFLLVQSLKQFKKDGEKNPSLRYNRGIKTCA